jgi:uncharacterized protein
MKKIVLLISFLAMGAVYAQKPDSLCEKRIFQAHRFLDGRFLNYSPSKAFQLFIQCAREGVPYAMNAVGIMYQAGIGIDTSETEALKWFEQAANVGYPKAWYNLGLMYKNARGVEQDFAKAYEYFHKASILNYEGGWYAEGYMLYKGLGCEQDYKHAFELFKKGAEADRSSCMYMLALCYRNGYGTERDSAYATYWLAKSMAKGNKYANLELAMNSPENVQQITSLKSARADNTATPGSFKRVKHHASKKDMAGTYKGYMITYDWSGRNIVRQVPLALTLAEGDTIAGTWIEADSITANIKAKLTDTTLLFTYGQYELTGHYNPTNPQIWNFKRAALEIIKKDTVVYMAGNLQLYSPQTKEPGRPIYISLQKKVGSNTREIKTQNDEGSDTGTGISELIAFPNPFTDNLNLRFNLKNEDKVRVIVYSTSGIAVTQTELGSLPAGQHTERLSMQLQVGTYILKISCGKSEITTIIVKQ